MVGHLNHRKIFGSQRSEKWSEMVRKWRENGFTRLLRESLEMMGIHYAPMTVIDARTLPPWCAATYFGH
jgi:hypothetical protein